MGKKGRKSIDERRDLQQQWAVIAAKRRFRFRLALAVILVAVSMVVAVSFWDKHQAAQVERLKEWPLPEVNDVVWGTNPPQFPKEVPSFDPPWGQAMIRFIVQSHPDPEINQAIFGKMERGEMLYGCNYGMHPRMLAGFMGVSTQVDQQGYLVDPKPSLTFNCDVLQVGLDNELDLVRMWAVVSHEIVHYHQWEARAGKERENWDPPCELKWETELGAYQKECQLLVGWGYKNIGFSDDKCKYFDTPHFRHMYFNEVIETGPPSFRGCEAEFARLAGHPHPEAFRAR